MIRRGQTNIKNAKEAAKEFYDSLYQTDIEIVIFFCSNEYDLESLSEEINTLFKGIQVVGCSSAGEIGPLGYLSHSLSGVSFSKSSCTAVSGLLNHIDEFSLSRADEFTQNLLEELEEKVPKTSQNKSFALMLIDALTVREEPLTYSIQHSLGKIPLFGGSAGDGIISSKTHVYYNGSFHADATVLVCISTSLPFKIFKTQHFISTNERLVVTEANPQNRTVKEINGFPAAKEYARLLGIDVKDLNPAHFATSPVVVMIDGTDYVRSIHNVNPDGSLTFFCAIEEGLVLRVAHGKNLVENLEEAFNEISKEIGEPQLVIGCDCILRNQEITQNNQKELVGKIFSDNNVIGFSSYGEQFQGVHVNQTLTGIAIGESPKESQ
jgi:hypothetical protein